MRRWIYIYIDIEKARPALVVVIQESQWPKATGLEEGDDVPRRALSTSAMELELLLLLLHRLHRTNKQNSSLAERKNRELHGTSASVISQRPAVFVCQDWTGVASMSDD